MLRCKKGDLAIVVASIYSGLVVEVLEYNGPKSGFAHTWVVAASVPHSPGYTEWYIPDEYLLPIRPGDLKETDETEKEVESV